MNRKQENEIVGNGIEHPTSVEKPRNIDASPWNRLIENSGPWRTLKNLHKGGDAVKANQDSDQRNDEDVKQTPSNGREETSIKP